MTKKNATNPIIVEAQHQMGIYLSASNVVRLLADMFITALLIALNLSGENKKLVLSKIILHDIPITGQGRVTQS